MISLQSRVQFLFLFYDNKNFLLLLVIMNAYDNDDDDDDDGGNLDAELINMYGLGMVWYGMHGLGMYGHRAGDVAADNEAPVMYHRILMSAQYDDQYIMIQRVVMVIKIIIMMLI